MKRLTLLFATCVLSIYMIGCGETATAPAGTPGTGPATGPPTAGEAQKDRDKMFKELEEKSAKARAGKKG